METSEKHTRLNAENMKQTVPVDTVKGAEEITHATQTVFLKYEPPFPWEALLDFLEVRSIEGIERVERIPNGDDCYLRAVQFAYNGGSHSGWISVRNRSDASALELTMSESLKPVANLVGFRIRKLFDLDLQPEQVYVELASMDELREGVNVRGMRVPGAFDSFEMAARAILGQQITVKAARTLANRLVDAYGVHINTPLDGLSKVFPSPEVIAALPQPVADLLGPLGITGNRCRAIRALAEAIVSGEIELSPEADAPVQMQRLLALPGIGPWTVEYLAMRALSWPDAFPHTDYGVKLALKKLWQLDEYPPPKQILSTSEAWKPWRSYATMNLWSSLA